MFGLDPRWQTLAKTLVWRELVVRYKRSVVGAAWAFADPVINTLVYIVVFGIFLRVNESQGAYPLFVLCGVVTWTFVSMTIDQASSALLEHAALVRRVPFPHELLVMAVVASRLSTFIVALALAAPFAVAGIFGASASWSALWSVPVGILLAALLAAGLAFVAAAAAVFFLDSAFVLRFVLRFGFYACPVVYPLSRVPDAWRAVYELNPMVGILWFVTAPLVGGVPAPGTLGLASAVVLPIAAFLGGLWFLRRMRYDYMELL